MVILLVALGVVFLIWIVAKVIQKSEQKRKDEEIRQRQEQRKKEQEESENKSPFRS